ncbi:Conserved_hypothetical protein [Hexamita inflata]|uniref:Transmembrane protein n=1 Tax=Hexamita inflata TaxID=28002 RepID=A0AA86P5I7_9EUKA|nr:Conserved hypothetical protein [Hexamita inflata]
MICIYQTYQALIQQTFKNCFSPKSYISGNIQTNQLTLNLIPFDHIDQVLEYNQCKTALDKMNVQILLHFDGVSFPKVGQDDVSFTYIYNQLIKVVFTLTPADYTSIITKSTAMYELRYDLDYVIVNGSIKTIEHTKYNGTGCFKSIALSYTIYNDIDILVDPNNCDVNFATGVSIFYEFEKDGQNIAIPILPCSLNCIEGVYNGSTSLFNQVKTYRLRKTVLNQDLFSQFYESYVSNRLITISLNFEFTKSGVVQKISEFIKNKTAVDTWGCKTNDQPTASFYGLQLYSQLNKDGLLIQVRDVMKNKMLCSTGAATKVRVDHYMKQGDEIDRREFNTTLTDFNEMMGVSFASDAAYANFRSNIFIMNQTYSTIVVSYLDDSNTILYELTSYSLALIGCIDKQFLNVYDKDKICFNIQFEQSPACQVQYNPASGRNSLSVSYLNDEKIQTLIGYYDFQVPVNYSLFDQQICFNCQQYQTGMVQGTCAENVKMVKTALKRHKVTVHYINLYDQIQTENVIAQYSNIYVPLVVSAVSVFVLSTVGVIVLFKRTIQ